MSAATETIEQLIDHGYVAGFVTNVDAETFEPGLNEDVIKRISLIKKEPGWMTQLRLQAYHDWLNMTPPDWAHLKIPDLSHPNF